MKKIKVLHLAPHVGAGIGTVVFPFLRQFKGDSKYSSSLCILGYADERAIEAQKEIGFYLKDRLSENHDALLKEIKAADIVLIHWWNHPLLSDFLIRRSLPPSRIVIWCHISGTLAPNNLTDKILNYPDLFVFTTPLSYDVDEALSLPGNKKSILRDIWSTAGVEHLKKIKKKKHESFHVGYIGNVGHGKMHPDFLSISKKIKVPNIRFTVIGGHNNKKMEQEAKDLGVGGKFNFTGFVSESEKWELLSTFDVFGYPLSSDHYGSCDQVLQEAMVVGAVPVVLANPMESLIVKDGVTGIVAKNTSDYVKAVEQLHRNSNLRKKLAISARKHALRRFSLKRMVKDWGKVFAELLSKPKTTREWNLDQPKNKIAPVDVFVESLGNHSKPFVAYLNARTKKEKNLAITKIKKLAKLSNWQSETKSTVHNFNSFLKGDKYLSEWSRIMRGIK